MTPARPPGAAAAILRRGVRDDDAAEGILGDLTEEFEVRCRESGRRRAALWFWVQCIWIGVLFRVTGGGDRPAAIAGIGEHRTGGRGRMGMGIGTLSTDIRIALRSYARTPAFTVVAVLTLALGVGANAAMFSVVHGVLLRPLPYPDASEVLDVWPGFRVTKGWIRSYQESSAFDAVSGVWSVSEVLNRPGDPVELQGAEVNSTYLDVLDLRPALGRWFEPEDEPVEARPTVVISHDLWVREFGQSPDVLGRVVPWSAFGIAEREIIGVMPEGLETLQPGWDFWVPIRYDAQNDRIDSQLSCTCWQLMARLADGTSPEVASERTLALASRLRSLHSDRIPESALAEAYVRPLVEGRGVGLGSSLYILFGAVTLVLLVACVNVANLLLARGASRRQELAVRGAIGASRGRLVRQLMTESTLLGLAGGAAGVALALVLVEYLRTVPIAALPVLERVRVDLPVLFFTLAVSLVTGVVFGSLPALQGLRQSDLSNRSRTEGRRSGRTSRLLVTAEVSLAVVLVTAGGLLASAVRSLGRTDIGFPTEGLTTVRVRPTGAAMASPSNRVAAFQELEERLAALPGVTAVGATAVLPLSGVRSGWQYFVQGRPVPAEQSYYQSSFHAVSSGYHDAMRIQLLAGRAIEPMDEGVGAEPVALVSRELTRQHWAQPQQAVGETIELNTGVALRIVGVAEDVRHESIVADPRPTIYVPQRDFSRTEMFLVARSAGASPPAEAVREALRGAGYDVLTHPVRSMEEVAADSILQARLYVRLMAAFAALALLLGMVGIYGVMSYSVSQRTREFGLRMALGARGTDVAKGVAYGCATPLGVGLAMGIGGAALLSRFLSALVYGVPTSDPSVYALVVIGLVVAGGTAMAVPALRATATDPIEAMRAE